MKVIVLNDHSAVVGGAAQVAISSLNALADAGFDVTFVTSVGPVSSLINQHRVRVVFFDYHDLLSNPSRLDAALRGIWDSRCANQLGVLLSECDPSDTIVHLHTWVKSLSSSVIYEVRKRGFKLVCTLHDYFSVCPNGGLYNYPKQHHCEITPMSMSCILTNCDARSYAQKLWRYGRHVVQQQVAGMPSRVQYFISVSDYSETLLRPFLPSDAKIYRVRNPIDIDCSPASSPTSNDSFCFVGRLSPEKGGTLFARAARLAEVPAVFLGAGIEAQGIRELYPSAQLRGWQDRLGVIAAIRSSRALVLPSLWHETQGLVVLEAAALGVPAIVSDGCAAREAVIDGETGLLFKAGNANDLAKKLRLLRDDSQLAAQLGLNAYQRYWAAPCTLANHVQELSACYREALS